MSYGAKAGAEGDAGPAIQALRVVVAVTIRLYREGLIAALGNCPAIDVVAQAADRNAARSAIEALRPDVVVLDVSMRGGLDLVKELAASAPSSRVIAFAVEPNSADIIACAEAGAAGYVTADAALEELSAAIVGAVAGELACPPTVAHALFRRLGTGPRASMPPPIPLTHRERQVLAHLEDGLSNKEIARAMNLAVSTVKNHVHHLLAKLDVPTRGLAASRGIEIAGRRAREGRSFACHPGETRQRDGGMRPDANEHSRT